MSSSTVFERQEGRKASRSLLTRNTRNRKHDVDRCCQLGKGMRFLGSSDVANRKRWSALTRLLGLKVPKKEAFLSKIRKGEARLRYKKYGQLTRSISLPCPAPRNCGERIARLYLWNDIKPLTRALQKIATGHAMRLLQQYTNAENAITRRS
ncbi:uncharacterized protein K444DRAFT_151828 [Hyaloscypha bicolor E]|uniref:Uncharacterized protein n=1 Tax=Hyaloscypha bicolor E TaxID=1095630 RepID=A0A2J6TRZ2_9HELO|nr:uncharacterized protein K444DRAFT_151828 [Hyaloscypha bicolor E]PMD65772.1 hypothetical protein K444DRAFT_151828 [Hyaloscypha bicolor E]